MGKNYSSVTINIIPEFRPFFTISLDGSHLAKDNYLIGNLTQPPHQLIHVDQHFSELKFMLLLDPYRTPISRIYQSHFSSRVNNGQRNVIMICSSNSLVPSLCNQMTTLMFQLSSCTHVLKFLQQSPKEMYLRFSLQPSQSQAYANRQTPLCLNSCQEGCFKCPIMQVYWSNF